MIRVGERIYTEEETEEIREAVRDHVDSLKKLRKKCNEQRLVNAVREIDSKMEFRLEFLRLTDNQLDILTDPNQTDIEEQFREEREEARVAVLVENDAVTASATPTTTSANPAGTPLGEQIRVLTEEKATGDLFPSVVAIASLEACQKALEIIEGMGGKHETRRSAIQKRIHFIEGDPRGRYDFTDARLRGLEVLAVAFHQQATLARKTVDGAPLNDSTVAKKVGEWLVEVGLAEFFGEEQRLRITHEGQNVAAELGYIDPPEVEEAEVVDEAELIDEQTEPTEAEQEPWDHGPEAWRDTAEGDEEGGEESEKDAPAAVGAYEGLSEDDDLL